MTDDDDVRALEAEREARRTVGERIEKAEAEVARMRAVVEAARDLDGHSELCCTMQPYRGCTCGYADLLGALLALDEATKK